MPDADPVHPGERQLTVPKQGGVPTAGQLRAQRPLLGDKDVKKTLLFRELEEVTMNHFSRQQRVCPTRCHKKEEEASFRVPLLGLMAENH